LIYLLDKSLATHVG